MEQQSWGELRNELYESGNALKILSILINTHFMIKDREFTIFRRPFFMNFLL